VAASNTCRYETRSGQGTFCRRQRMRNDEELERPSGTARRDRAPARPRPRSIATRLFVSAALLSFAILLVAGLVLSTIYRRTAEANFDARLDVYLHALVADIATPGEDSRTRQASLANRNSNWP
jgi:hypothetical protein